VKIVKNKQQVNYLRPVNVAELRKSGTSALVDSPYWTLLLAIADALDTAVSGNNTYCIIGTTKDTTALSMTVVQGDARDAVYADTLVEMSDKASQFIDP